MSTDDLTLRALFASLLTVLPGCYAAHQRGGEGDTEPPITISADPAFVTAATPRPAPTEPGCGTPQWAPLAPAGLEDLRRPTLVASDGGFVASVVHAEAYEYTTAVGRMRSDLTDMLDAPREAGIVTNRGETGARPAMSAGDDGRLAACAVAYTNEALEFVPGGVAFFDRTGALERRVGLDFGCADVAFIDGRWVAIEVTDDDAPLAPRGLAIFDTSLAIARRIPLGYSGDIAIYADRLVGVGERVVVAAPTGWHEESLLAVDLESGTVTQRPFPFAPPIDLTSSQLALLARGDSVVVTWIDEGGTAWWMTVDETLEVLDHQRLGEAASYTSYVDIASIEGGVAITWVSSTLELALVTDDGVITRVETQLPASVTGGIDTLEVATQGDVVAIVLQADDPIAASRTVGIWSARCAAR